MKTDQLYTEYLRWLGSGTPVPREAIFAKPLANRDIYEDSATVINRLYFAVPHFAGGRLRLFVFFEVNRFLKGPDGDLSLSYSEFYIPKDCGLAFS